MTILRSSIRRAVVLFALLWVSVFSMYAQQVTKEAALKKAEQFFNNASFGRRAPRQTPELTLANNRDEFYVFNDEANGGYVIVSGEERMPDVLAYSRDSRFDADNIPCNMQAWLEGYAEQVKYLRAHPEAKATKRSAPERENVGPLLTSWYSQGKPYNNKCPEVNGFHTPTGCVATAMAQIMNYWQWPKQTTDVIPGYTTSTYKIDMPTQPITTIDWKNILNQYDFDGEYTEEQIDAISTLMLLCGTSLQMDYIQGGSAADPFVAIYALSQLFCYDYSIGGIYRDDYETDKWEQIIIEELNEGRPLLYSAYSNMGGHSFVLDGYENGYFHVNWGWGVADSWVLMTGEERWQDFTMAHRAVIGIQPAPVGTLYGVFDNGTMTLYYDQEMASRSGTVLKKDEWENYKEQIKKCVIDPSFANISMRNLHGFFDGWTQLESIEGIENLNTSKTVDMGLMFGNCSKLQSLDCSSFKTDNVENMSWMFYGCSGLTSLDVSGFNTDKVKYMQSMFQDCRNLTSLDLSGFNTVNVTNMTQMFYDCRSLTSLDLSGLKTDKVVSMPAVFYRCRSLTSLDLSGLKTDKVTDMRQMFAYNSNLTTIYASDRWNMANVELTDRMFLSCSKIVGGAGTTYDQNHTDGEYARIDEGTSKPGYFTYKTPPVIEVYKLIYLVDGKEYKTYDVEYGSAITSEPEPMKEGYTFSGWSEIPETMPAHDVTIEGAFEKNILLGDVNGDGIVSVTDVTMVISHILGQAPQGFNKDAADVNGDGNISVTDVTILIDMILKQ